MSKRDPYAITIPSRASLRSAMVANREYAIRIPIGMTDLIILFGNTEGNAFLKAVRRAMRGKAKKGGHHN